MVHRGSSEKQYTTKSIYKMGWTLLWKVLSSVWWLELVNVCYYALTSCSLRSPGSRVWHGLTWHSLVSVCKRQAQFLFVVRAETPGPQLWEQGLQSEVLSIQLETEPNAGLGSPPPLSCRACSAGKKQRRGKYLLRASSWKLFEVDSFDESLWVSKFSTYAVWNVVNCYSG